MTYQNKPVGVVYNHRVAEAVELAESIARKVGGLGWHAWSCSVPELQAHHDFVKGSGMIITVGGDGTILRAARIAAPHEVPLLGVNLGRLGFMTELRAEEALDRIPAFLEGEGRVEERAMLQAEVLTERMRQEEIGAERPARLLFHALNDVVVGRGSVSRLVRIRTLVDGVELAAYRADAVIVATATGSTGYNLAAGGPILQPQAPNIILTPLAPHLGLSTSLVFLPETTIDLLVGSDTPCTASIDGYVDMALSAEDRVRVTRSPYHARFLRTRSNTDYYATLIQRLGLAFAREGYRAGS